MTTKFETEITVRPNEIDINRHVHQSVYLDYVLFARYDQMRRCYKMSMEEFFKRGYTWATKSTFIEFRSPVFLGERVVVRTWVEKIRTSGVQVRFQILKAGTEDLAADGYAVFVMINISTGKPEPIPEDIKQKYSV